jgi:hypothetical protein
MGIAPQRRWLARPLRATTARPPRQGRDRTGDPPIGVDLECGSGRRGGRQDSAVLRLEVELEVTETIMWPVPLRVVQVRQCRKGRS